jgi:serine/threonine-protein kinase RsbW
MSARERTLSIANHAGSRGDPMVAGHGRLRRRPVPPAPSPRSVYSATATAVGQARHDVARLAREAGASQAVIADIELAVSEASSNAVTHAYRASGARGESFAVSTATEGPHFTVWVTDEGQGATPEIPSPGLGVGLQLMAKLCEHLLIGVLDDGRTQLEMRFHLQAVQS